MNYHFLSFLEMLVTSRAAMPKLSMSREVGPWAKASAQMIRSCIRIGSARPKTIQRDSRSVTASEIWLCAHNYLIKEFMNYYFLSFP